jgi:hypothetical protein
MAHVEICTEPVFNAAGSVTGYLVSAGSNSKQVSSAKKASALLNRTAREWLAAGYNTTVLIHNSHGKLATKTSYKVGKDGAVETTSHTVGGGGKAAKAAPKAKAATPKAAPKAKTAPKAKAAPKAKTSHGGLGMPSVASLGHKAAASGSTAKPKNKGGRPKGSKNKPKAAASTAKASTAKSGKAGKAKRAPSAYNKFVKTYLKAHPGQGIGEAAKAWNAQK